MTKQGELSHPMVGNEEMLYLHLEAIPSFLSY